MKKPVLSFVVLLIAGLAMGCGNRRTQHPAASEAVPGPAGVRISGLFARPSPDGVTVGAVYATLRSEVFDTLVAVSVPSSVAARAEAHAMVTNASGQMEMVRMVQLPLPAGLDVEFKPGGRHIMLFALARPLVAGNSFPLTLLFSKSGEKVVEVPIRGD